MQGRRGQGGQARLKPRPPQPRSDFQEANRLAPGIAAAHGCEAQVHIEQGFPVTLCDDRAVRLGQEVVEATFGTESWKTLDAPIMGAEDWSYVLQEVPGSMAFLGACPPDLDPADSPGNHSNLVVFDEEAMVTGVALYSAVALEHLAG